MQESFDTLHLLVSFCFHLCACSQGFRMEGWCCRRRRLFSRLWLCTAAFLIVVREWTLFLRNALFTGHVPPPPPPALHLQVTSGFDKPGRSREAGPVGHSISSLCMLSEPLFFSPKAVETTSASPPSGQKMSHRPPPGLFPEALL